MGKGPNAEQDGIRYRTFYYLHDARVGCTNDGEKKCKWSLVNGTYMDKHFVNEFPLEHGFSDLRNALTGLRIIVDANNQCFTNNDYGQDGDEVDFAKNAPDW